MGTLKFIEYDHNVTEIALGNDHEEVWYAVSSSPQPYGQWSSSIVRTHNASEKSNVELASILYVDWRNTYVRFGEKSYDVNAFLRRRNIFSNSRIFVAPDGETYKWSIHGHHLELCHTETHVIIARSYTKESNNIFSRKQQSMRLEILQEYMLGKDSKMLDAIMVTFIIMQHKLEERTKYRHGSWY